MTGLFLLRLVGGFERQFFKTIPRPPPLVQSKTDLSGVAGGAKGADPLACRSPWISPRGPMSSQEQRRKAEVGDAAEEGAGEMANEEGDLGAVFEEGGQEPEPAVASGAEDNFPPTGNKEMRRSIHHCWERSLANGLSELGRRLSPELRGASLPGDTLILDA